MRVNDECQVTSHLQLVDEDRDLHSHFFVVLHHQVVGEGGTVHPVHHHNIHILHPEQGPGQLLHPGRLAANGPVGVKRSRVKSGMVGGWKQSRGCGRSGRTATRSSNEKARKKTIH